MLAEKRGKITVGKEDNVQRRADARSRTVHARSGERCHVEFVRPEHRWHGGTVGGDEPLPALDRGVQSFSLRQWKSTEDMENPFLLQNTNLTGRRSGKRPLNETPERK